VDVDSRKSLSKINVLVRPSKYVVRILLNAVVDKETTVNSWSSFFSSGTSLRLNGGIAMSRRLHRLFVAAIASPLLALGCLANAAFYSSNFDPPGPLSFAGTALFQIDDACLGAGNDGFHTAASCNLALLSATLSMTDTNSLDTGNLNFAPVLPNTADLIDLLISGGELAGVNSDLIGFVFAAPCTGTLCGVPWWIQWGTTPVDPVFLYTGNCDGPACFPNDGFSGVAENVSFTRVNLAPEPGTMGLLIAALGVGWLVRRRSAA
jgi:hypothetical protein